MAFQLVVKTDGNRAKILAFIVTVLSFHQVPDSLGFSGMVAKALLGGMLQTLDMWINRS